MHISDIDPNFKVETNLERKDIHFYDVKKYPQIVYGLQLEEHFMRMPSALAEQISQGVVSLNRNTSGGRLRFVTDSDFIALSVKVERECLFCHMAQTGISGFDMYVDGVYRHTFFPQIPMNGGYDRILEFSEKDGEKKRREILIHFPLYNYIDELFLGLQENCCFETAMPYGAADAPVIFYGSSITQGGCVSRPGCSYPAYVSRWLDVDFINLGFSGNAKGELCMAEHIASLNPSVFVMDYDHNAPNSDFLQQTHEPFFKTFRSLCPDTPVIMMTAPDVRFHSSDWLRRRQVIRTTYENARAAGDDKVFFLDGQSFFTEEDWFECTVDSCHPTDLGHYRMAKAVKPILQQILENLKKQRGE